MDYRSTSWSGKIETTWEGPYIIQHLLGKSTYHIKSTDPDDTLLKRVHGNRLKIYVDSHSKWNQTTRSFI